MKILLQTDAELYFYCKVEMIYYGTGENYSDRVWKLKNRLSISPEKLHDTLQIVLQFTLRKMR